MPDMGINQYAEQTLKTAMYPPHAVWHPVIYPALKLGGEVGEVQEQIGKAFRDDEYQFTQERLDKIANELGDVIWYWTQVCYRLGLMPADIMQDNLRKLQSRKLRGVIRGEGSDR